MKEQISQFDNWKLIKKFLGWNTEALSFLEEEGVNVYRILDDKNRISTELQDTEEEAWREAYQDFKEHSFEYWEDWNILMGLIDKVNEHIKKNSPPKYSGIVIYDNRVWIDSQPVCTSIHKSNQNIPLKYKTQETLLLCAYEICLRYLKLIR